MKRKARDSCGRKGHGRPRKAKPEEAPGPPAESECLQRKSTAYIILIYLLEELHAPNSLHIGGKIKWQKIVTKL